MFLSLCVREKMNSDTDNWQSITNQPSKYISSFSIRRLDKRRQIFAVRFTSFVRICKKKKVKHLFVVSEDLFAAPQFILENNMLPLEYPSTSHNINVNMRHGVWRDYRNCAVTLVRCPRSPLAISDSRNEVTFTAHNGPLWDSGGGLRSPLQPTQLTKDHSIWRQKPLHIEGSRSGI